MFNNFSSFLRLSLCLFLSTGLHGGLFVYDWMTGPIESRLAHAPVVVSFLPAVEVASPIATERAPDAPAPALSSAAVRPVAAKPANAAPRPLPSPPRQTHAKALAGKPAAPAVDKPKAEPSLNLSAAEMACLPPQAVAPGPVPVQFDSSRSDIEAAEAGTTFTESANPAPPAQLQEVEKGLLDSTAPPSHALIEAVPNYRSNPLPEYPYLARQKHWEGVVWLMVDVSADGLVDDLRVERSCGHQVLDRAAHRTVRNWRFSPAKRAGLPVSSQVRIPVRFRLEDG